jgi:polygalacturonase
VEISNCDIACGDDAVVVKTTRQAEAYHGGTGSARIVVKDCVMETQDAGVKIGTETTRDIRDVTFERCTIRTSSRGIGIQLRDEGTVSNIVFKDITFTSRYYSDPWWGRGEAISLTAIPRTAAGAIGKLENVRIENVTGRAENSARVEGSARSRIRNVEMRNVSLTLDRWTRYGGGTGRFDNRPTRAQAEIEMHSTPGFCVRHADGVALRDCTVAWGDNVPAYFSHALLAEDVTGLVTPNFRGAAAHAGEQAIMIR